MPSSFDPATGTLEIAIVPPKPAPVAEGEEPATPTPPAPEPVGISANKILFLFEAGPPNTADPTQGAQYLGEFRVAKADGLQATLVTVNELDEYEKQRLANSRGPWSMYETMPVDQLELFAGLSEEAAA